MKIPVAGPMVAALAVIVSTTPSSVASQASPAATAVESTIKLFLDSAVARFDYSRFDRMVTPTARFIEAGRIMDAAAFKEFMRGYEGRVFTYELSDFRTFVVGEIAYTSYRNRGAVRPDGTRPEWLESAVLRRSDGVWRIDQFQSASVPRRPTPPPSRDPVRSNGEL